jgi:hypothetical protein
MAAYERLMTTLIAHSSKVAGIPTASIATFAPRPPLISLPSGTPVGARHGFFTLAW